MKRCCTCKETKALDQFCKDLQRVDGKRPICRACESIKGKAYRERNKARNLAKLAGGQQ